MLVNYKWWFFIITLFTAAPYYAQWKCGDCSPRIRFEPIDFGYPYGRDWDCGVYLEVPLPYRDEQGRMFAFGWHR